MYACQEKCIPLKVQFKECLQSEEKMMTVCAPPLTSTPTRDHLSENTFSVFVLSKKLTATFFDWLLAHLLISVVRIPNSRLILFPQKGFKMTHKTTADLIFNQDAAPSEDFALS